MAALYRTLEAVSAIGSPLTATQFALSQGITVEAAHKQLQELANAAGGFLQVSRAKEILYCLDPETCRKNLRRRIWWAWLVEWKESVAIYFHQFLRIFFGSFLIASIVLIFAIIAIILIYAAREGSGSRRSGGNLPIFATSNRPHFPPGAPPSYRRHGLLDMHDILWIYMWHNSRPRRHYRFQTNRFDTSPTPPNGPLPPNPPPTNPPMPISPTPPHLDSTQEYSFIQSVFSFLFGDDDPNADLEVIRWQAVAECIRRHGGAVIAEQIAPFLDTCLLAEAPNNTTRFRNDLIDNGTARKGKEKVSEADPTNHMHEAWMLEVVRRFDGVVMATDDGQLVYTFPSLMTTFHSAAVAEDHTPLATPPFLETEVPFSLCTPPQLRKVVLVGGANLIGWLLLRNVLLNNTAVLPASLVPGLWLLWRLLGVYAVMFFIVPAVRAVWLKLWTNRRIALRNAERKRQLSVLVAQLTEATRAGKLEVARRFAMASMPGGVDPIVYTTRTNHPVEEALLYRQSMGDV